MLGLVCKKAVETVEIAVDLNYTREEKSLDLRDFIFNTCKVPVKLITLKPHKLLRRMIENENRIHY